MYNTKKQRLYFISVLLFILSLTLLTGCDSKNEVADPTAQIPDEAYRDYPVYKDIYIAENGISMPYRIYFPKDYDSNKTYPLLLYLHEAGARGDDNLVQIDYTGFLDGFLSGGYMEEYPSLILIPQCAEEKQWVDIPWTYGWYSADDTPISESLSAATELLSHIIDNSNNVDTSRLYVLGLSMGGYGTWDIITRNPDLFAAAVPCCGGCDVDRATDLLNMPIWTFHGSEDPIVPNTSTREIVTALKDLGSDSIRYTEYEGEGHIIEPYVFYNEELYNWLFQQQKTTGDKEQVSLSPVLEKAVYTGSNGCTLPYQLYTPFDMDDTRKYPLILFLHGAGERGTDNELQANDTGIVPRLINEEFYSQNPSIILAPQCGPDDQWVDTPWTKGSYSIEEIPVSEELAAVTELINTICREYPVNPQRLYAIGVSMGGYGAWDMILRNPDLFSGGVILCGAGDPAQASKAKDIPLWIFHGTKDTEVPLTGSTDMVQALEEAGAANVHYTEYPDIGHWIWMTAWDEEGLLEGLFACRK